MGLGSSDDEMGTICDDDGGNILIPLQRGNESGVMLWKCACAIRPAVPGRRELKMK